MATMTIRHEEARAPRFTAPATGALAMTMVTMKRATTMERAAMSSQSLATAARSMILGRRLSQLWALMSRLLGAARPLRPPGAFRTLFTGRLAALLTLPRPPPLGRCTRIFFFPLHRAPSADFRCLR